MGITAKTAGNRVIHDAIMESRSSIAGGDTISAPLAKSAVFPPMGISMIAVGEQTGGLDEMLTKIADFYDTEVDTAVSGLLSLMEPGPGTRRNRDSKGPACAGPFAFHIFVRFSTLSSTESGVLVNACVTFRLPATSLPHLRLRARTHS